MERLGPEPLVSVLIANHDYERYLPAAIESALHQSYPRIEVVVVDDGSSDGSREVIGSYGDAVVAAFQERGGQVSALNAAFALSRGDVICLLDADDVFLETKVERVVSAWRHRPDALLVHHQAQIIDAEGRPRHSPYPRRVVEGDLRAKVQRTAGWFPHAPSGALAFHRGYAARLFPVPERQALRRGAGGPPTLPVEVDTYLAGPAALLAPVIGIPEALTLRRIHDANRIATAAADGHRAHERIARYEAETDTLVGVMRDRFGTHVRLDTDRHLDLQLARCAAGDLPRPATALRVLGNPVLPRADRPREALRVLVDRGPASRGRGRGALRRPGAPA